MAKSRKKFYTVWKGHEPGVYDNWEECLKQVKNFPGASYKGFPTREEAEQAFLEGDQPVTARQRAKKTHPELKAVVVDAACSGNPGLMEYRGVLLPEKIEWFHHGPVPNGTNNIGEFLAIVHALSLMEKHKLKLPVYSDSRNAILWVKAGKANTKLPKNKATQEIWSLIQRAERWLANHDLKVPVKKWPTEQWGEIPADFGRK